MARKRVVKGTAEFYLKDSPYVVVKLVRGSKTRKGYVQVRVTGKGGVVRTAWVKESTFKTNPKYAHLREDVKRYYRQYPAEKYRPVERESAMVPYDEKFAKGQVERPKEVAVSKKTKRWTKARKRMREGFPGAFESGAYKKMEEVAAAAKKKIEEEETKKRAEKAGAKISIKGIEQGDVFKVVLIIIFVTLILAFISWLSSIF